MAIHKTEAIVIRKMDFRDTSLIVTLFTRDFGKVKVVVKGIRKEASSELVHFEILNHLNVIFYEKTRTELHLLSESYLEDPMLDLRRSFETLAYGWYLAELVDALFELHEVSPVVFDALLRTLKNLEQDALFYWALHFELILLKEAGLSPGIGSCIRCGKTQAERFVWSARQGGVLCGGCAVREIRVSEISPEALRVMREPDPVQKNNPVFEEIEKWIREFIRMRLEYPVRSQEFLESAKTFPAKFSQ